MDAQEFPMTPSPKALQVLWAEDSDDDRLLIRAAIEELRSKASIRFVRDGASMLEAVARDRPDLVVLDQDMPGMKGMQAMILLRARDANQSITLFTSHLRAELGVAAANPRTAYVQKPIEFAAFVAAIGEVLRSVLPPKPAIRGRRPRRAVRPTRPTTASARIGPT